jgi:hypothetical protein
MKLPLLLMVLLMFTSIFGYGPGSGTLEFRIRFRIRLKFCILADPDPDPQHCTVRCTLQSVRCKLESRSTGTRNKNVDLIKLPSFFLFPFSFFLK